MLNGLLGLGVAAFGLIAAYSGAVVDGSAGQHVVRALGALLMVGAGVVVGLRPESVFRLGGSLEEQRRGVAWGALTAVLFVGGALLVKQAY